MWAGIRVPFASRVSPETVCAVAVVAAALASAATWVGCLRLLGATYRHVDVSHVAPCAAISATVLALGVVRATGVGAMAARSVLGGSLAGFAATAATCAVVSALLGRPLGTLEDFALGTSFGTFFGAACLIPALELRGSRRDRAHSALDVQLVNTGAWLAIVAAPGAVLSPERTWALVALAIAALALVVALAAAVRWFLRRRWLMWVFAGHDEHWSVELDRGPQQALPVAELLCSWSDELRLVRVIPPEGSAYRAAGRRVAVARVAPATPV